MMIGTGIYLFSMGTSEAFSGWGFRFIQARMSFFQIDSRLGAGRSWRTTTTVELSRQVDPGVANVRDQGLGPADADGGSDTAHAPTLGLLPRGAVDPLVGAQEGVQ